MQNTKDVLKFHDHETANVMEPLGGGPLKTFLLKISKIQKMEEERRKKIQPIEIGFEYLLSRQERALP